LLTISGIEFVQESEGAVKYQLTAGTAVVSVQTQAVRRSHTAVMTANGVALMELRQPAASNWHD